MTCQRQARDKRNRTSHSGCRRAFRTQDRWLAPNSQTVSLTDTGFMKEFEEKFERRAAEAAARAEHQLSHAT
jgi:hypothetical protein